MASSFTNVRIDALRDAALSWHMPAPVENIRGIRLFIDAPRGSGPLLSVVRSIVRANPRIGALDALALAVDAREASRREGVDPQFVAATLLQESAFDPNAISLAGAYGIAQLTVPTAEFYGIDPFDPRAAIAGAAHILATYLARYAHVAGDPYAFALAAYNAGPGTVTYYGGVPPYPETRAYIADIHERWARLLAER
ncbi:MAG: lytic transglycosylase domain-containing protein [Candidatus Velthaea sp.]